MNTADNPPDSESIQSAPVPSSDANREPGAAREYNTRVGLRLFIIYLVLYVVFVLINAFAASVMEVKVIAGLNLAIVYGFGLIIAAVVMAFIYGAICRTEPSETQEADAGVARDQK